MKGAVRPAEEIRLVTMIDPRSFGQMLGQMYSVRKS
jgi:hypothetical protein